MPCYRQIPVKRPEGIPGLQSQFMYVPCGRCIGCKLERKRQWALRIMHESQMHERNSFITLTYADESLVYGGSQPTLDKRELQLFWKRLRKEIPSAIRYFACGEYGSKRSRPHYHACIFGYDFPEKELYSVTDSGDKLYRSSRLDSIWSNGNCIIGALTSKSAAYVAGYIVDKRLGKSAVEYKELGIEPEFVVMSRRPGIGRSWYDKYAGDIYPADCVLEIGGKESRPPRYYDNLRAKDFPLEVARLKAARVERAEERISDNTLARQATKERVILHNLKNTTRQLH